MTSSPGRSASESPQFQDGQRAVQLQLQQRQIHLPVDTHNLRVDNLAAWPQHRTWTVGVGLHQRQLNSDP
jgi:hypothetical protein